MCLRIMHCHHIIASPWCNNYKNKTMQIYIFNPPLTATRFAIAHKQKRLCNMQLNILNICKHNACGFFMRE